MFAHTNKLFLVMIALSAMTYFQRADYNLPLFAFAILLWNYREPQQKTRLWYLMAFSLLTDAIWIIYWAVTWNSYNNREIGVCTFTVTVSCVEFLVKIATVAILFVNEPECKSAISNLPSNFTSIFSNPNPNYQSANYQSPSYQSS